MIKSYYIFQAVWAKNPNLNRVLRGHYAYSGIAGNIRALQKVHAFVVQY